MAAFGKPNLSARTRPLSDVVFENGSIASNIRNAYHLVSVDENRLAFRPTLMNFEPRVSKVWFPGVHSDVGGGYRIDGLSDITLKFMCDKAKLHGLKFLRTEDIPMEILSGIDADGKRVEIDRDDIEIKPDSRAQIHYHEEKWRTPLLARRTLAPREIIVMQKDLPSDRVPIVHHTVFKRAKADKDYRPDSLWNIEHRAINTKNGSMLLYNGLEDHLRAS